MCGLVAEAESMNKPLTMFGALTLGAVAFVRAASRSSSETQIYPGEMFGDRMTETSISGSPPRLHESTTFIGGCLDPLFQEGATTAVDGNKVSLTGFILHRNPQCQVSSATVLERAACFEAPGQAVRSG
jgi:hypothetical protein